MKSRLLILELILSFLHSIFAIKHGKVVGYIHLHMYYSNPQHEAKDGFCDRTLNDNWCDTYFKVCVTSLNSSIKCNVYSNSTEVHFDKTYVKYDDRNAFLVPLTYPVPKSLGIEVSATDYDRFTEPDLIGLFVNEVKIPPTKTVKNAGLVNVKKTTHNQEVNLTVLMVTKCSKGFYGDLCSVECVPEKHQSMIGCYDNGTGICLPGFRGEFCEKPDACFYNPCIPGAECLNADEKPRGYMCICDGIEGVHCYASYNPCVPSPCKNQGQCVRMGEKHETFACNCPIQWSGRICEIQRSPCEVANHKLANANLKDLFGNEKYSNQSSPEKHSIGVCKNGGICVDLMEEFKFICNCTSGWKGELCEIPDWTYTTITVCSLVGLLLIFLCAIIPCCLQMTARRRKRIQARAFVYNREPEIPAPESIEFKDIFNKSGVGLNRSCLPSADNTLQLYENCMELISPEELATFASNVYELSEDEKLPPKLPDRPDCLTPIARSPNTPFGPDACEPPYSSRSGSTYSGQPLLTPGNSAVPFGTSKFAYEKVLWKSSLNNLTKSVNPTSQDH